MTAQLVLALEDVAAVIGATAPDLRAVRRVTKPLLPPVIRHGSHKGDPLLYPFESIAGWLDSLSLLSPDTELRLRRAARTI